MRTFIIAILLLGLSNITFAENQAENIVEVETKGSYLMGDGDSKEVARKLALFEAKKNALESAWRYISNKTHITLYTITKDELYSLAASDLHAKILKKTWEPVCKTLRCFIRIRAKIQVSDFFKAEIQSQKLREEDKKESLLEEMDPNVSKKIDPGKDIAKAYRLLQNKSWRMVVIYLNRLAVKYPNWGDIYMVKAIAFYALNEPSAMKKALKKACGLGNHKACDDLKRLKKVHKLDLDSQP